MITLENIATWRHAFFYSVTEPDVDIATAEAYANWFIIEWPEGTITADTDHTVELPRFLAGLL